MKPVDSEVPSTGHGDRPENVQSKPASCDQQQQSAEGFYTVRLAALKAPDGWYEFGRPGVEEFVLAYSHVRASGDEYHLPRIPAGRWHRMAGKYRPSMHRSRLASSQVVELKEGESLRVDFDLTEAEWQEDATR